MERIYINVDYQVLRGGIIKPVRIYWNDGRAFDVRKTVDFCTDESDSDKNCYTVLIGNCERKIYRIGYTWFVESENTKASDT